MDFDSFDLVRIVVPIAICVVLPVCIVLIIALSANSRQKMRTQVLLKAIESNSTLDADKLAEAMTPRKKRRTAMDVLNERLLLGCICTLMGIAFMVFGICYASKVNIFSGSVMLAAGAAFLVVYFVTRGDAKRQMAIDEVKAGIAKVEVVETVVEND